MKASLLFTVALLSASRFAWGQDCGGMPAVNGVCIPPDSSTSPLNSSYGIQGSAQPQLRQSHWRLTWGAIAISKSGDIGVVIGKVSARGAKREAMAQCGTEGALDCKLALVYQNQCAVIAKPSQQGSLIAGTVITGSGPTIEETSQEALASCSAAHGGGECKIIYSDCTKPVLVQ
jgi:hypothetical protein